MVTLGNFLDRTRFAFRVFLPVCFLHYWANNEGRTWAATSGLVSPCMQPVFSGEKRQSRVWYAGTIDKRLMNAAAQELLGLRVLPGDHRLERSARARSGANFCGEKCVLSGENAGDIR